MSKINDIYIVAFRNYDCEGRWYDKCVGTMFTDKEEAEKFVTEKNLSDAMIVHFTQGTKF